MHFEYCGDSTTYKNYLLHMLYMKKLGFKVREEFGYNSQFMLCIFSAEMEDGYIKDPDSLFATIKHDTYINLVINKDLPKITIQNDNAALHQTITIEYDSVIDKDTHKNEMYNYDFCTYGESLDSLKNDVNIWCNYIISREANPYGVIINDVFLKEEIETIDRMVHFFYNSDFNLLDSYDYESFNKDRDSLFGKKEKNKIQ